MNNKQNTNKTNESLYNKKGKYIGPINRPCSACSAGDYKMKYHDHDYVDISERRIAKESEKK
jgi:hypothetical protein